MDVSFLAKDSVSQEDEDDSGITTKNDKRIPNLYRKLPDLKIFTLHKLIGEGSYSSVYLASLKCDSHVSDNQKKFFAIKHLVPIVHPDRIEQELWCLKYIGGCDNVVGVHLCLRHYNTVVFVMPYVPHTKFSNYFMMMDLTEIKLYMKNLLLALRRIHKFNIIHRDIKPSNFLYDRESRRYLLVDFGLAQKICYENELDINSLQGVNSNKIKPATTIMKRKRDMVDCDNEIVPNKLRKTSHINKFLGLLDNDNNSKIISKNQNNINNFSKYRQNRYKNPQVCHVSKFDYKQCFYKSCMCNGKPRVCEYCLNKLPYKASRSGTQGFRPPEVLLKYPDQTTAVDIWACGVIFLSFLSGSYPFFRGSDDVTGLAEFITVFGSGKMKRLAKLLGRELICNYDKNPYDLRKLCTCLRFRSFQSTVDNLGSPMDIQHSKLQTKRKIPSHEKLHDIMGVAEKHEHSTNYETDSTDMKYKSTCLKNEIDNSYINISRNQYCDNCALANDYCVCLIEDNTERDDNNEFKNWSEFPNEAFDLLERLLDINPYTRITAADALQHPFLANV